MTALGDGRMTGQRPDCTSCSTNLGVRAGRMTELGDVLQPPYEKHQTVHAVNGRAGRAEQIAWAGGGKANG